jgi:hypothetical protein
MLLVAIYSDAMSRRNAHVAKTFTFTLRVTSRVGGTGPAFGVVFSPPAALTFTFSWRLG